MEHETRTTNADHLAGELKGLLSARQHLVDCYDPGSFLGSLHTAVVQMMIAYYGAATTATLLRMRAGDLSPTSSPWEN